jgi:hypothetical protein
MAKHNITNAVDLYEHLAALPGIEVFLLAAESIYGTEGLAGLRLIANALNESVRAGAAAQQPLDPGPQISPRLAQAEALLAQARAGEGVAYIVCFRFEDEAGWHLRWSDGWSHMAAVQALVEVIRHSLLLDECGE